MLERVDLPGEWLERPLATETKAEMFGEADRDVRHGLGIMPAGQDRRQGVEEEVGLELGFEPLKLAGPQGRFRFGVSELQRLHPLPLRAQREQQHPDAEDHHPVADAVGGRRDDCHGVGATTPIDEPHSGEKQPPFEDADDDEGTEHPDRRSAFADEAEALVQDTKQGDGREERHHPDRGGGDDADLVGRLMGDRDRRHGLKQRDADDERVKQPDDGEEGRCQDPEEGLVGAAGRKRLESRRR